MVDITVLYIAVFLCCFIMGIMVWYIWTLYRQVNKCHKYLLNAEARCSIWQAMCVTLVVGGTGRDKSNKVDAYTSEINRLLGEFNE